MLWAITCSVNSLPGWMSSCFMSFLVSLWICSTKKLNTVQFVLYLLAQSKWLFGHGALIKVTISFIWFEMLKNQEQWQKSVEKIFVKVYCESNYFQLKNVWLLFIVIFSTFFVGTQRRGSRSSKRVGIGRENVKLYLLLFIRHSNTFKNKNAKLGLYLASFETSGGKISV